MRGKLDQIDRIELARQQATRYNADAYRIGNPVKSRMLAVLICLERTPLLSLEEISSATGLTAGALKQPLTLLLEGGAILAVPGTGVYGKMAKIYTLTDGGG